MQWLPAPAALQGSGTSLYSFRTHTYPRLHPPPQKRRLVITNLAIYSPYHGTRKGVLLIQLSGRPEKTHWGAHSGSCFNNKNKLAKGKRRTENCQDLRQVNIFLFFITFLCMWLLLRGYNHSTGRCYALELPSQNSCSDQKGPTECRGFQRFCWHTCLVPDLSKPAEKLDNEVTSILVKREAGSEEV